MNTKIQARDIAHLQALLTPLWRALQAPTPDRDEVLRVHNSVESALKGGLQALIYRSDN